MNRNTVIVNNYVGCRRGLGCWAGFWELAFIGFALTWPLAVWHGAAGALAEVAWAGLIVSLGVALAVVRGHRA